MVEEAQFSSDVVARTYHIRSFITFIIYVYDYVIKYEKCMFEALKYSYEARVSL